MLISVLSFKYIKVVKHKPEQNTNDNQLSPKSQSIPPDMLHLPTARKHGSQLVPLGLLVVFLQHCLDQVQLVLLLLKHLQINPNIRHPIFTSTLLMVWFATHRAISPHNNNPARNTSSAQHATPCTLDRSYKAM